MKRTLLPMGTQHPVLPEPIVLDLILEDERVVDAVPTIGEPFIEAFGSVRDIDIGNADPRKTQLNAPLSNARRECSHIGRAIALSATMRKISPFWGPPPPASQICHRTVTHPSCR